MLDTNQLMKFVVPSDNPPQIQNSPHLARLKSLGELTIHRSTPSSIADQIERVREAQIILNSQVSTKWSRSELEQLPNLRLISTCSVGTDMIDLEAARDLDIIVSNQADRVSPHVAEHIVALLLTLAKKTAHHTKEMKAGRWHPQENVFLRGKVLGIIGAGNIGREVAKLGNAMGMNVISWTFNPTNQRAKSLGVEFVELDQLLMAADAVTIQVILSDSSKHILGARELGLMKEGALLVNAGRGELIDSNALVDSLNSNHLGGAGLDVFEKEPIQPDHPILSCKNVVLTPHVADYTPEGIESLNEGCVDNVISFLDGFPCNVVNP